MRVTSGGRVCVIGFRQDTPVIVDQRSETQRSCGSSALRRGHPALDDFALCSVCGASMCATGRPAVSQIESVRPLMVEPLCLCDVPAGRRRAPLLGLLARCGALDETCCWSRPLFSRSSGL